MHDSPVEVFASPGDQDCRERELVLRAQGVPYWRAQRGGLHVLVVEAAHAEQALAELETYERENRDWPPRDEAPRPAPWAIQGTAVALFTLVLFYFFQFGDAFGFDWLRAGRSVSQATAGPEPWRAVTALFLHTGPTHLLANLIFGALFGFLVALTHGGAKGWFWVLVGGALGNLANAFFHGPDHFSVGASTAVFAAVGILGGSEWRRRHFLKQRRLRRAAPIVMALLILSLHGVPEDYTVDVFAHVFGVLCGLPIGALIRTSEEPGADRPQWVYTALGVAVVAGAWALALVG